MTGRSREADERNATLRASAAEVAAVRRADQREEPRWA